MIKLNPREIPDVNFRHVLPDWLGPMGAPGYKGSKVQCFVEINARAGGHVNPAYVLARERLRAKDKTQKRALARIADDEKFVAAETLALTAIGEAWVQIKDGATLIKEGVMKAGDKVEIPPTAVAPKLTTGKAEALTISVGTTNVPQVGPSATKVRDVSLLPANLLRGPSVAAAPAPRPAPPPAARPVEVKKPAAAPAAAINIAEPAPPPKQ